jgi:hypothetical protein
MEEGRSKAPRALGGGSVYGTAYVPTCRRWTDGPLTAQELPWRKSLALAAYPGLG